ncbi:MAG: hypothetical protein R3C52_05535 [Hyphomonadaceae bacterium]
MIRSWLLALTVLGLAACAAPPAENAATIDANAAEQVEANDVIAFEGKPLITPEGHIDNAVLEQLSAHPDACAKAGGEVRPVCMMGKPMCVIAFKDAGKPCTDSSQCSGRCLGDGKATKAGQPGTGRCAPTNNPCGCFQTVRDGIVQPTLCVD